MKFQIPQMKAKKAKALRQDAEEAERHTGAHITILRFMTKIYNMKTRLTAKID